MENAAEALKMAAAILIFIIAIASTFSLFGTAKQTADSIITMRDKQAYLDSAEVDNGILYTSTSSVGEGHAYGVNDKGDRIVSVDDVVSTILRYNKEKYGVTIIDNTGTVLARFDSNTEDVMRQWYNIVAVTDSKGNSVTAEIQRKNYAEKIKKNIETEYKKSNEITLELEKIYSIKVNGNDYIKCGAPWYGNDEQIRQRIACELSGNEYEYNGQSFERTNGLLDELKDKTIVEVTKEIDNSTYLKDTDEEGDDKTTDLLQQYEMPTVEIIYIIQNNE